MGKIRKKLQGLLIKTYIFSAVLTALSLYNFSSFFASLNYFWIGSAFLIGFSIWFAFKLKRTPEKHINKWGYVVLTREKELEHRYIAKQKLGRDLKANEIVHHINGKKTDNEIKNLCVMDSEKHEHFHSWVNWKKTKSGFYPSFSDQKRALVKEYNGILIENIISIKTESKQEINKVQINELKITNTIESQEKTNSILSKKLFDELRKERNRLAIEKKIPAYMVFSNKTLHEMIDNLPDTDELMSEIRGIGEYKLQMYGSYFTAVIKKFKSDYNIESKNKRNSA
ncbi:MAG TPA: HRDC domain-containing protein [Pseudobdellovibrionaceae bacterium]|nr:HRDC domain-containing protein [Pseudobdellovibrionaceae bacterium]